MWKDPDLEEFMVSHHQRARLRRALEFGHFFVIWDKSIRIYVSNFALRSQHGERTKREYRTGRAYSPLKEVGG
jgi:hypothetical protein